VDVKFERKLLKEWLALEEIRAKIIGAAGSGKDYAEVSAAVRNYISAASSVEYKDTVWYETLQNFENALSANLPTHFFPLLKSKEKGKVMPWEYEGRTWYYWLHLFSKEYGWTEAQIAKLDIDTAIGLLQEIVISEQVEHEWQWSMTEIAYPYNKNTKKSEFQELPRPDWMKKIVPAPKKVMMRIEDLPKGLIIGEGYESKTT
jgi:hypothetical protein